MITIQQLVRMGRAKPKKKVNTIFMGAPQKSGTCTFVGTAAPRKPNSAKRKFAKVRLRNGRIVSAYIRGIGHNLQVHSRVVIENKGPADMPGLRVRIIRGVADTEAVKNRKTSRSRYGVKKG